MMVESELINSLVSCPCNGKYKHCYCQEHRKVYEALKNKIIIRLTEDISLEMKANPKFNSRDLMIIQSTWLKK